MPSAIDRVAEILLACLDEAEAEDAAKKKRKPRKKKKGVKKDA